LKVSYRTLIDYLSLLKYICCKIDAFKEKAMVYLAAAVSDFFIPKYEMPQHKIQSAEYKDGLTIHLKNVPKLLGQLKSNWCSKAYTISFKLETDANILNEKCIRSLKKYNHELVIGNLLHERKNWVCIIRNGSFENEIISIKNNENNIEIEELIVDNIVNLHKNYQNSKI
jgi:phosphopantothenate---cysteine ligase (ATP)